mgnify:CR=1 FL=1
MATKWKNRKPAAAFAAFFLGVTLLLYGVGTLASAASRGWNGQYGARDVFADDYQNTAAFRGEISGRLNDFIAMAVGGPLNGYYWGDSVWPSAEEQTIIQEDYARYWEEALANGAGTAEVEAYDDWLNSYGYGSAAQGFADNKKELEEWKAACKKQAEDLHRQLCDDKNLLYAISYGGKELFSNAGAAALSADPSALPDGYSFLLVYEKGSVAIYKDGRAVDVYGDGYYRDDGTGWCVPGYKNFAVDDESKNATVLLAAARAPKLYVTGRYAQSGASWHYSGLYGLEQHLARLRAQYLEAAAVTAAGLALLAVSWLLRAERRTANAAIARITGSVWFECKVLAALAAVGCPIAAYGAGCGYAYAEVWEVWSYSSVESMALLTDTLGAILRAMLQNPFTPAVLFWLCWLLFNDWRHNPRPWRKSFYQDVLCARGLSLPVTQRLVRRAGWTFAAALALVFGGTSCLVLAVVLPCGHPVLVSGFGALVGLFLVAMTLFLQKNRAFAQEVEQLTQHIAAMRGGTLDTPLIMPAGSDLAQTAENLNDLQRGIHTAIDEQMKSERMKVALVANVSHDIKTPLTSIISYIELLRDEPELPEHARDYVRILDEKSQRLKTMVQDVFEVSKAASGELPVKPEPLDFAKLLRQTLADMSERIAQSPVTVKEELPEKAVMIVADGQRMYRVFQNLIGNALQYSLEGSRVYVTLRAEDGRAVAVVRNTSRDEIPAGVDFTARFVRGDESRTDGGSGLGLSIASSFTEACGGKFSIAPVADLFTATVSFPLARQNGAVAKTAESRDFCGQ